MSIEEIQHTVENGLAIQTDMGKEMVRVALECVALFDKSSKTMEVPT